MTGISLVGSIDICNRDRIAGWVVDKNNPQDNHHVEIMVDDRVIAQVRSDLLRNDLKKIGYGPHGFDFKLFPHHFLATGEGVIRVRVFGTDWFIPFGKGANSKIDSIHRKLDLLRLSGVSELREHVPFGFPENSRATSVTLGLRAPFAHPAVRVFGLDSLDPKESSSCDFFSAANSYMPPARCFFFRGALVGPTGAVIVNNKDVILETMEGGVESQGFVSGGTEGLYFVDYEGVSLNDWIDEPVVTFQRGGFANYALWLTECLPRAYAASLLLADVKPKYLLRTARLPSAKILDRCLKTLSMIGISVDDILIRDNRWDRAANLYVPIVTDPWLQRRVSPSFIACIQSLVSRMLGDDRRDPWRKIYVSRQDAFVRRVSNEDVVIRELEARGFEVVCPGDLSFEDQVRTFAEAEIVVGPHGAGLVNVAFMAEGARLVEIFSRKVLERRTFRDIAVAGGLRYCAVVSPDKTLISHEDNFAVDVQSLIAAVDYIASV